MFCRSIRSALATGALLMACAQAGCDSKTMVTPDEGPVLSITSPTADTAVSGVAFLVRAVATDEDGIARVEFSVGDEPAAVDDAAPFEARILTLTLPADLALVVTIRAIDALGNTTETTLPVTVSARTLTQLTTAANDDSHPSWSPNGTRMAFQADRDGSQLDLWIMDADGGNQTRLTTNVNEDRHPAFSPDGAWIAFDSDREGTFDVWLLPLATGEANAQNRTFGNNDDVEPAWSPGGVELFFSSSRGAGDFNIFRQDLGTSEDFQLTSLPEDERAPAVSPDGSRIAFVTPLNFATPHVYAMRLGEVDVTPLTGDIGVTESDPAWTVDGDAILFSRSEALSGNIWLKNADSATAAAQVTFGTGVTGDGGAAWHPDGDKLAFHSDRSGNLDIWLLE